MALPNRDKSIVDRQKLVYCSNITVELYFKEKTYKANYSCVSNESYFVCKNSWKDAIMQISQESRLLSNFSSLPKIRIAHFGHCGFLGVNTRIELFFKNAY